MKLSKIGVVLLTFPLILGCFLASPRTFGAVTINGVPIATEKGSKLFVSPQNGTFLEGSTFDVSVFLDTQGNSVNGVEMHLKYPSDKISLVRPSNGESIIGLWVAAPEYSNAKGTADFSGIILRGINTGSGLVITLTFKAIAPGNAIVKVMPSSKILLNDGFGTNIISGFGQASYTIVPKPPDGVRVYSETHQFQDKWYNNPNPVMLWDKDPGVDAFSYILDDKPETQPGNNPVASDTIKNFENVADGVRYFHIKARKENVWGATTHFAIRIDTAPPAEFVPKIDIISSIDSSRAIVSFFTTDYLSGMDHYEVGAMEKSNKESQSPAFVESQSPYELSSDVFKDATIIVRAVDKAGNVRDEVVKIPFSLYILAALKTNPFMTLFTAILLLYLFLHYLFSHRVLHLLFRHHILRRMFGVIEHEEAKDQAAIISGVPEVFGPPPVPPDDYSDTPLSESG